MKKIVKDILMSNGKWSYKRITALYILNMALLYAYLPAIKENFEVKEFVFMALLTYSGTMVGVVAWEKKNINKSTNTEEL